MYQETEMTNPDRLDDFLDIQRLWSYRYIMKSDCELKKKKSQCLQHNFNKNILAKFVVPKNLKKFSFIQVNRFSN